jgi:hypothetical protein
VFSRIAPWDSASTQLAEGFIDELIGQMDYIFVDAINAAQEANDIKLVL